MHERIKQLRSALNLTQQQFAEAVNLSRNYIAAMETGRREPGARTISDICRVYGVNEVWLRTGAGEMFRAKTRDEELAEIFARAQIEDGPRDRLLRTVAGLPPELCEVFLQFVIQTARQMKEETQEK